MRQALGRDGQIISSKPYKVTLDKGRKLREA
jgi:hypothetical protein